jgi:hypothetical protein
VTPEEAVVVVEKASSKTAAALLGKIPAARHRELKVLIHPDRFAKDDKWRKRAEAAVYKLDTLYAVVVPTGRNRR